MGDLLHKDPRLRRWKMKDADMADPAEQTEGSICRKMGDRKWLYVDELCDLWDK